MLTIQKPSGLLKAPSVYFFSATIELWLLINAKEHLRGDDLYSRQQLEGMNLKSFLEKANKLKKTHTFLVFSSICALKRKDCLRTILKNIEGEK